VVWLLRELNVLNVLLHALVLLQVLLLQVQVLLW
jgi:hypothetical protein